MLSSWVSEFDIALNALARSPISSSPITGILFEKSPLDIFTAASDIRFTGLVIRLVRKYSIMNISSIGSAVQNRYIVDNSDHIP